MALGAATGAGLVLPGPAAAGDTRPVVRRLDFAAAGSGEGWGDGWRSPNVANLRRAGGAGVLEAGSDVFPNDPRPVAFAVDCRVLDGSIRAVMTTTGAGAGVVARRTSPADYYAAVYDSRAARAGDRAAHRERAREARALPGAAGDPAADARAGRERAGADVAGRDAARFGRDHVVARARDDAPSVQRARRPGCARDRAHPVPQRAARSCPRSGTSICSLGGAGGPGGDGDPGGRRGHRRIRQRSTVAFRGSNQVERAPPPDARRRCRCHDRRPDRRRRPAARRDRPAGAGRDRGVRSPAVPPRARALPADGALRRVTRGTAGGRGDGACTGARAHRAGPERRAGAELPRAARPGAPRR